MNKFLIAAVAWALTTPSASTPAAAACGGDCSGDGEVTVNELIIGVNIALGSATVAGAGRVGRLDKALAAP